MMNINRTKKFTAMLSITLSLLSACQFIGSNPEDQSTLSSSTALSSSLPTSSSSMALEAIPVDRTTPGYLYTKNLLDSLIQEIQAGRVPDSVHLTQSLDLKTYCAQVDTLYKESSVNTGYSLYSTEKLFDSKQTLIYSYSSLTRVGGGMSGTERTEYCIKTQPDSIEVSLGSMNYALMYKESFTIHIGSKNYHYVDDKPLRTGLYLEAQ
jgi:hypothetical protein